MGYDARWSGEITIDPPILITFAKDMAPAKPQPTLKHQYSRYYTYQSQSNIQLRVVEESVVEEPGVFFHVINAALPVMDHFSSYRDSQRGSRTPDRIVKELQALVDQWPHHEFTGHLQARGPDGNPWRVTVIDRRAVEVQGVVVWPDDEALVDQLDEMLQPELSAVVLGLSNARNVARAVLATICKAGVSQ